MEKNIMATTLADMASKLNWGWFLYKVVRKVDMSPNSPVMEYDLLTFDYSTELVELFYKSQIIGHVVVDDENKEMNYLDYVNSNCVHGLTRIGDVEEALYKLILDKKLFAVNIEEHASNPTFWRDTDDKK